MSTTCAIGVDLGGTKIETALVSADGELILRRRDPTNASQGSAAVQATIVSAAGQLLQQRPDLAPVGVGVGVAGQVELNDGIVRFAPNLNWRDVPLQADLAAALHKPVIVANDVRVAAYGEWMHGAGRGCDHLICLFIGTGIGGGVVSQGQLLSGCSNTAGELGHMTVDLHGPQCHCGNPGCMEALASGWAIARTARDAITADPAGGVALMKLAGGQVQTLNAQHVAAAAHGGDPLAQRIVSEVSQALVAGCVGLINAFNPCRLILGGGICEGFPELIPQIDAGVRRLALPAAVGALKVLPAALGNDAGVVGAAAMAMQVGKNSPHASTLV